MNIPSCPEKLYTHEGLQVYGHWLGTGNIRHGHQQYMPFGEALLYARSFKLKTQIEWRVWQERCTTCQCSIPPGPSLQARGVARVRALAGHWQPAHQKVPAVQKGLLCARSLKLKSYKQRSTAGQRRLSPRPSLQARAVARVRALARYIKDGKQETLPFQMP